MPDELDGIDFAPDADAISAAPPPRLRARPIGRPEMAMRAALLRPRGLLRVLRLLVHGNVRGAAFRFARLFDAIAGVDHADRFAVQCADDVAAAPAFDTTDAPRVLFVVGPGSAGDRATTRAEVEREAGSAALFVDPAAGAAMPVARTGDLLFRVAAGARLGPGALRHLLAPFLDADPPALVHCDEDRIDRQGRPSTPFHGPAWDPLLVAAGAVPLSAVMVRRDRIPAGIDPVAAPAADLATAVVGERFDTVVHVPRVLVHVPDRATVLRPVPGPRIAATDRPSVSVVIPTRDRADLLEACLRGLAGEADGVDLDVVVVDNGSVEPATRALFERLEAERSARVVAAPGAFDFARLCNLGVAASRHERVLLLNNDVEPIAPGWLRIMAGELEDPTVGVVGARLLFPDGTVQHAGVVLGDHPIAGHAFAFLRLDGGEDRGLLSLRREMSCVTGACLMTRRTLWDAVGGMDEGRLAVAFNDVDYCLAVRAAGGRVIWTPEATLIHRESVSRGRDDTPEKHARFVREEATMAVRWRDALLADPFGNPNLSCSGEPFLLAARARDLAPRRARAHPPTEARVRPSRA